MRNGPGLGAARQSRGGEATARRRKGRVLVGRGWSAIGQWRIGWCGRGSIRAERAAVNVQKDR